MSIGYELLRQSARHKEQSVDQENYFKEKRKNRPIFLSKSQKLVLFFPSFPPSPERVAHNASLKTSNPILSLPHKNMTDVINLDAAEPESALDAQTHHRYRVFKKNSPFLYDYLSTHSLLWPSLTVQFFPDLEYSKLDAKLFSAQLASQRLLLGTFTLGQATDAIHIHQLPYYRNLNACLTADALKYNPDKAEFDLPTVAKAKLRSLQSINHHGDVNKLKYMPQNPDIIAAANNVGNVRIYNRTKHSTIRKLGDESKVNDPQLSLVPREDAVQTDIFAVDWNPQREGVLATASMAGHMDCYDIRGGYETRTAANEIFLFWNADLHTGVNDLEWVHNHDSVLVTADDAGILRVHDVRVSQPVSASAAGAAPLNSLSINPLNNFCVSTGDARGTIATFDMRSLTEVVDTFQPHLDAITQVKWHPRFSSVLGSSSGDRLVKIYDMGEQANTRLSFSHEGHMLGVNDFDWSLSEDWMIASVSDDNSLHVWRLAEQYITKNYK